MIEKGKSSLKRCFEDESDEKEIIDLTEEKGEYFKKVTFKVIFPSMRTVMNSFVGPEEFGTLFCKGKDFASPDCPREIFYDCSTNPLDEPCKYSMHSKIMTVSIDSGNEIFHYCGSHNFTASAWGKRSKQDMFQVTNFEVGVILKGFKIEYPYYRPASKYSIIDIPWDQTIIK